MKQIPGIFLAAFLVLGFGGTRAGAATVEQAMNISVIGSYVSTKVGPGAVTNNTIKTATITTPPLSFQTCVVHRIRNLMRFSAWNDRRHLVAALKPIYTAPTADAAAQALEQFDADWGQRYGAIVDLWRRNWDRFVPFLDFDPAIRKVVYTTNAIESLNYQLRKVTKTRGSFPTDDAVLKIFYLAIDNIGHHRGGELGSHTQGWKHALNAFAIAYPNRIPDTLS